MSVKVDQAQALHHRESQAEEWVVSSGNHIAGVESEQGFLKESKGLLDWSPVGCERAVFLASKL